MYNRCDDVLNRIKNGIYYNNKLKLYTKEYLENILNDLSNIERYEDCSYIKKFINRRFNHFENYKSPIL